MVGTFLQQSERAQAEFNKEREKEIWNAAIEAAAEIADDADEIAAADIRKLKK